ncbi:MAG: L-lactate MFS transporter [Clostridium chrysemydis]|uniref:L-lactate MFS transporter n=1 Tax=Clostridium chrysemydis TaxID=2665504 RepID=UPI003F3BD8C0
MKDKRKEALVVIIGTVITQLGLGSIYTWSLFNQPIVNKFGWGLSDVALTFSIASFALSVSTLAAGKLQERFGIRKLTSFCGIMLGVGLILTSKVSSIGLLYILAGILVGAMDGIAYITTLSNAIKWFPNKKGLISGISVGAYGTGSLIFKYINSDFINKDGFQEAFMIWGIIAMVLIIVGAQLLKDAKVSEEKVDKGEGRVDFTVKEMLKTKQAYLLFIVMFTACMSGLYLIGIVKDIGVKLAGLDVQTAANAVAMVAVFNTIGRLILGAISDKFDRLKVIMCTLIITLVSVLVLCFVKLNFVGFFTCVACIAFCFGGNITIFPAIVGDFFGLKNHSKNYGVIYQGFGLGALSGSVIATIVGGFKPTFIVVGVLCMISIIIVATIKPPIKKVTLVTNSNIEKVQFNSKIA